MNPTHRLIPRALRATAAGLAVAAAFAATPAAAQIRIGELNSYKAQPAFLEPYRKGWELALEEITPPAGCSGRRSR